MLMQYKSLKYKIFIVKTSFHYDYSFFFVYPFNWSIIDWNMDWYSGSSAMQFLAWCFKDSWSEAFLITQFDVTFKYDFLNRTGFCSHLFSINAWVKIHYC